MAGSTRRPSQPGVSVSDVDFVTALCSQVVYEGLVDDTFRIKCGMWRLSSWGRLRGTQLVAATQALGVLLACGLFGGPVMAVLGRVGERSSSQNLTAVPSALKGSVDFGPEITSSEKSLKVLLNAEDKVRVWALAVGPRALLPLG